MNDIKIGTLLTNGTIRPMATINFGNLTNCPNTIFDHTHYRPDGSCKCNDKSNTIMKKWGYKWNAKAGQWS
jgi:hypothetical protein